MSKKIKGSLIAALLVCVVACVGLLIALLQNDEGATQNDPPSAEAAVSPQENFGKESHEHVMILTETIRSQSCVTDGIERYVCACGVSETRLCKAVGHQMGEWSVVQAADCFSEGSRAANCQTCGQEVTKEKTFENSAKNVYN